MTSHPNIHITGLFLFLIIKTKENFPFLLRITGITLLAILVITFIAVGEVLSTTV